MRRPDCRRPRPPPPPARHDLWPSAGPPRSSPANESDRALYGKSQNAGADGAGQRWRTFYHEDTAVGPFWPVFSFCDSAYNYKTRPASNGSDVFARSLAAAAWLRGFISDCPAECLQTSNTRRLTHWQNALFCRQTRLPDSKCRGRSSPQALGQNWL